MGLKKAYDPKAPRKRKDWFYKTLEYLAQTPEPISVSELSRALNCSQPIIFKIFEQLENEWSAIEKHSWGKNNINLKYALTLEGLHLLCYLEQKKYNNGEVKELTHNDDKQFMRYQIAWRNFTTGENDHLSVPAHLQAKQWYIKRLTEFENSKNELPLDQKLKIGEEMMQRNSMDYYKKEMKKKSQKIVYIQPTKVERAKKGREWAHRTRLRQEPQKEEQRLSNEEIMKQIRDDHKKTVEMAEYLDKLVRDLMAQKSSYPELEKLKRKRD